MLARSAQALLPSVHLHPRQEAAEQEALSHLGTWAIRFSSQVSLSPPCGLVLEIGGSLRLFGGLDNLLERVRQELESLGHRPRLGVAPTIRGAELLARAGGHAQPAPVIREPAAISLAIRDLPLKWLGWPDKVQQKLRAVGLQHIGSCLDLPRAGFCKRYGTRYRQQLDQIIGNAPDPRMWHQPPPRFRRQAELFFETERSDILLPGFARLFADLAAYLYGRDCGLSRIQIQLRHPQAAPTALRLGLQKPSRDPDHWLRLLAEQLDRVPLPEPVRAIGVAVDQFDNAPAGQSTLFPDRNRADRAHLLEKLSARLGPSTLCSLGVLDDHRPEYAWQRRDPNPAPDATHHTTPAPSGPRPLWLLDAPRPISNNRMHLLSPAERIESGWWDGRPCRRDYYQARADDGRRLWVFREYLQGTEPARWFVHGYFA